MLLRSHRPSELAHHRCNLLGQGTHTTLTGVLLDDEVEGTRGKVEVFELQAVLLGFLGYKVLLSDLELLFGDIARDLDELHTVTQSLRDGGDIVRRSDEEDLREVVVDVEVVIVEGSVLLGVEDFEQGRGRVALVVT